LLLFAQPKKCPGQTHQQQPDSIYNKRGTGIYYSLSIFNFLFVSQFYPNPALFQRQNFPDKPTIDFHKRGVKLKFIAQRYRSFAICVLIFDLKPID
jgi:hypothetical protein